MTYPLCHALAPVVVILSLIFISIKNKLCFSSTVQINQLPINSTLAFIALKIINITDKRFDKPTAQR